MSGEPRGRVPSVFDVAFLTGVAPVTELILVRHGQQHIPDPRRGPVGDLIDPPLSEIGRRQAELVGKRFAHERIDAVFTSNLQRAHDTGLQVAQQHGLTETVVDDLREIEIFRDIAPDRSAVDILGKPLMLGLRKRMIAERRWDVYPYSESSFDFRKRTVNAIEAIAAIHEGHRVVIACHGGVINAYIAHLLKVDEDMFFHPAHTAVNVVLAAPDGSRALQSVGDVHHLLAADPSLITF